MTRLISAMYHQKHQSAATAEEEGRKKHKIEAHRVLKVQFFNDHREPPHYNFDFVLLQKTKSLSNLLFHLIY